MLVETLHNPLKKPEAKHREYMLTLWRRMSPEQQSRYKSFSQFMELKTTKEKL